MKHIRLRAARKRAGLTQQGLEELSGVDRTRISKLERDSEAGVMHDTYDALDKALRKAGAIRRDERLAFGHEAGV